MRLSAVLRRGDPARRRHTCSGEVMCLFGLVVHICQQRFQPCCGEGGRPAREGEVTRLFVRSRAYASSAVDALRLSALLRRGRPARKAAYCAELTARTWQCCRHAWLRLLSQRQLRGCSDAVRDRLGHGTAQKKPHKSCLKTPINKYLISWLACHPVSPLCRLERRQADVCIVSCRRLAVRLMSC